MRIGKIHTHVSRKMYAEDEIDRLNNRDECLNCKSKRIFLCKQDNHFIIRACENKKCFLFTDTTKLKTWIKLEQNK